MQEKDFKKLLIDTVKITDHPDKEKIINLLRLVTIHYEQTGEFTYHLWNHYKEYIYLCIIPDKLIELKSYSDYLCDICYEIYPPNDDYELFLSFLVDIRKCCRNGIFFFIHILRIFLSKFFQYLALYIS